MRRSKDRFRVRLGGFWLQGEMGWGALDEATPFTREEAEKKLAWLKTRGVTAKIEEPERER